MAAIACIGFGELGSTLAQGLTRTGLHEVRAFTRPRADAEAAAALARRIAAAGAVRTETLPEALAGAALALAVVPATASAEMAEASLARLARGAVYADLSAAAPDSKRHAAALAADHGVRYADVAVLGTVMVSGIAVPMLASGEGADAFRALVAPAGLQVTPIDAPAGHATLTKLLRSVYMKGRDALVLEMVLAARSYGLADDVLRSIGGAGENVPFEALAERVLTALAVHAGRRADELQASSDVVRAAGIAPLVTSAGSERLRWLAELGVREAFHGERPQDARAVLEAIEALMDS